MFAVPLKTICQIDQFGNLKIAFPKVIVVFPSETISKKGFSTKCKGEEAFAEVFKVEEEDLY